MDGKKLDLPAYSVRAGETISVSDKMKKNVHVMEAIDSVAHNLTYLNVDRENFSAHLIGVPTREEIPVPVAEQLVVEFYTRLT